MMKLVVRVAIGVMALVVVLLVAITRLGPIMSGAYFLAQQRGVHPVEHPLSPSYVPLHKGGVDLATGLYTREDDDLVLKATPPFVLRRTYLTRDRRSLDFGVGSSHNGDWYLYGDGTQFQWAALVLADRRQVRYDRISSGHSFVNAMYENRDSPTEFYGSRVGWDGSQWVLRQRNGSVGKFLPCDAYGEKCVIVEWLDPDGHRTRYSRDSARRLTSIDTGSERIFFEYDQGGRIQRVHDQASHAVTYTYDAKGRLRKAVGSDGVTRSYEYDDRDLLTRIEEPGRIVKNEYDANARCIRQHAWFLDSTGAASGEPYVFEASYKTSGSDVVESTFRESGAPPVRAVYNAKREMESETYDPDTDNMVLIKYDRDAITNLLSGLTVSCRSGRWHFTRSQPASRQTQESVKEQLLEECRKARRTN
jgi:YD repeat-containing protein